MTKQYSGLAQSDSEDETPTEGGLQERLTELSQRATRRGREQSAGEESPPQSAPKARPNRGRPSNSVVEDAQLDLLRLEQEGRVTHMPLRPESEYPSLLTRIPIFLPGSPRKQQDLLDSDNAIPFETSWGSGRKHGPPLTVYDEDTLIALFRLRKSRLTGRPEDMPVPVAKLFARQNAELVDVHITQCMLTDIQRQCGGSCGGRNLNARLKSVKRLAAQVIEFERASVSDTSRCGTSVKLMEVVWNSYHDNALIYIQFHPSVAHWLEQEYTYINWSIRKQLTNTGKAIHRFLASQPKQYQISIKKLSAVIGYQRDTSEFLRDIRKTMARLVELGWVDAWEIEGNGRRTPYKLVIERT